MARRKAKARKATIRCSPPQGHTAGQSRRAGSELGTCLPSLPAQAGDLPAYPAGGSARNGRLWRLDCVPYALLVCRPGRGLCSYAGGAVIRQSSFCGRAWSLPACSPRSKEKYAEEPFQRNFAEGESFLGGDASIPPARFERLSESPALPILPGSTHRFVRRATEKRSVPAYLSL